MHLKYSDKQINARLRLLSVDYCCAPMVDAIHGQRNNNVDATDRLLSIVSGVVYYDHIRDNLVLRDSHDSTVKFCPYCGAKIKSEMVSPPDGASFGGSGAILMAPDCDTQPEYYEDEAYRDREDKLARGRNAIYINSESGEL